MDFEEIRRRLDKAIANHMRMSEEHLFGEIIRPFSQQEGRLRFPDDGKEITLNKDDCRVLEEEDEQSNLEVPPLLGEE